MSVSLGVRVLAQQPATQRSASTDSIALGWSRTHAIPLRSVDAPYVDSTFAFLRPLVGNARILAEGELVHGSHQPLAFRNEVIRYAVTHLGFTALALETGFTEAEIIDRFIQGGAGNIDTVVRTGFTWEFEVLPENHELVAWLRSYNAGAAKKVHFYGLDVTGSNDSGYMPGASKVVLATLRYMKQVAPAGEATASARLLPLMDRFMPARYAEYSPADRELLRTTLGSVYLSLLTDSSRYIGASSSRAYALGVRNAWMAVSQNGMMAAGAADPRGMDHATLASRDSIMAENVAWVLRQVGNTERVLVYAHDGHVMNVYTVSDSVRFERLGHRLRRRFGPNLVILATAAGTIIGGTGDSGGWIGGSEVAVADPASFSAMLAAVGPPTFALDLRAADHTPSVAKAFGSPWPFLLVGQLEPIIPRQAFDAVVYFDRITPVSAHR